MHTVTVVGQAAPSTEVVAPIRTPLLPSPTRTGTQTLLPTETLTSVPTATPSATTTRTRSPSPTRTAVPTWTPSPMWTPTPTWTLTPLPAIIASYPIDGDRAVPEDARFLVLLSSPVDPLGVAASFAFSPTVEGSISWPSEVEIAFQPEALVTDTVYAMVFSLQSLGSGVRAPAVLTATFETGDGGVPVPILMYHRFRELDADATQGQRDWSVSPSEFAVQMDYLVARGYHSIHFGDLLAYVDDGRPLPSRPVIISMDDGWREIYDVAWPVLRERGLLASLFVLPDYAEYSAYANWDELKELAAAGFYFGSHSLTHPDLRTLPTADALAEICESKGRIEAELDQPIVVFCYPMGAYNQEVIAKLEACGYRAACTLAGGYYQPTDGDGLFRLKRVWVYYDMTVDQFAAKLPW